MITPREDELFLAFKRRPGPETLAALLRGCQDSVYNLCHQVLRHPEDAEDVSQEVLIDAARTLPSIDAPRPFKVWLYKAALHRSLNLKDARARRIELARRLATRTPTEDPPMDAEEREALMRAIGDLDDRTRCLLLEHYFDKLTLEEIGVREGVSGVAIWKKLEQAREQLRRSLAGLAVLPLLESFTPAVAPSGLVAKAVAAGGLIVGTKSTVTAGTLIAAVLLIGAASTGGYLAGSNRMNARVRELERERVAIPIPPRAQAPEMAAAPSTPPEEGREPTPLARDSKAKPTQRESVPDTTPIRFGRPKKAGFDDVVNASSWDEFYRRLHEKKFVDVQKTEDLIFERLARELGVDVETADSLRRTFEAEREEVTRKIVENAGGPVGFARVNEGLGQNWKTVYEDWRRQREIVRRLFESEYLKLLTYDKLQIFSEHLRNEEIRLESSYNPEGRYHLIGGVGKPAK